MKKAFSPLAICFYLIALCSCKEYADDLDIEITSNRIKQISVYNIGDKETTRHVFFYEKDRVVIWKCYDINESDELTEIKKTTVSYDNNHILTTSFMKIGSSWEKQRKCTLFNYNGLIQNEVHTRISFPACNECWKYTYKYQGNKLREWIKYGKKETDDLQPCRKGTYIFENEKVVEYNDFIFTDNKNWKKDYKRFYSYENGELAGWEGGTFNDIGEWIPSQKIEYSYVNNNISERTYSVSQISTCSWQYFGSLNYCYNDNNDLIEESSSQGSKIIYIYEKGHGNASLLYNETNECDEAEPVLKSAFGFNRTIQDVD